MGLIINKSIPMFIKGYPTVSDKYNVAGATLETGSTAVKFGDLVQYGDTKGYFKAIAAGDIAADTIVTKVAGFVLATNVKLNEEWPEGQVQVNPGEAFNLALGNTFMAVELVSTAVEADITANASVYVTANGELTTSTDGAAVGALTNVVFTGLSEKHGETLYAEIYIK